MKKFLVLALLSLFSALLFSGCPKKAQPTPGDTLVGTGSGQRGDWIGSNDVYSDPLMGGGTDGLAPRDINSGLFGADGSKNVFESIYFGFDEYNIRASERGKLTQVADHLNAHPGAKIIAEGHTDWFGTEQYNLGLSDRRATSVKDYLTQLGVSPSSIEILAMGKMHATQNVGKDDPAAVNERRVDVILAQ